MPDLVPSFYERDIENHKLKFKKSIEARMLDKIRMKKVHYQEFGRNTLGPPKASSLSVSKKNPTILAAKSVKVIKDLSALARKPSRGSAPNFSNQDYNYNGN